MDRLIYRIFAWLCLGATVFLWGCQSEQKDTGWKYQSFVLEEEETPEHVQDSVAFILAKTLQHNPDFETFQSPMDIKIRVMGMSIGMNGTLRIANGRAVWGTVTKMIEAVRFYVTPDSLMLWDKLHNRVVLYTDTVLEVDGKNFRLMPFVYSFAQCFLLCRIDTVMLQGKRKLNNSDPDYWIIDGTVNDSVAWQCNITRNDYRIKQMLVSLRRDSNIMQAQVNYLDEGGFDARISANENVMFNARLQYTRVKWNEPVSFPFNPGSSVKILHNQGLMNQSREVLTE